MTRYFSKRYQRHKRIKRILSLNDGYDAYRPKRASAGGFLFPRYTWFRFFITLAAMIILAIPLNHVFNVLFSIFGIKIKSLILTPIMMAIGFFIVEVVDEFFLEWEKKIDRILRVVLPIMGIFFLAMAFVISKNKNSFVDVFMEWRESINDGLQSKPTLVKITPTEGSNWRFIYDGPGALTHLTRPIAVSTCKGLGPYWMLYDGDHTFVAKPPVIFSRPITVWMNFHGAQLNTSGIQPPKVYQSTDPESKLSVLCINKKVKL